MNKKTFLRGALAVLVLAGLCLWALPGMAGGLTESVKSRSWQTTYGGKVVVEKFMWHKGDSLSPQIKDSWIDSTQMMAAGTLDTTAWMEIAGAQSIIVNLRLKAWDGTTDSVEVNLRGQVSCDTAVASNWYFADITQTFAKGFSTTAMTGGTGSNASGDSSYVWPIYYQTSSAIDSVGRGKDATVLGSSRWFRLINSSGNATGDTLRLWVAATKVYPPVAIPPTK